MFYLDASETMSQMEIYWQNKIFEINEFYQKRYLDSFCKCSGLQIIYAQMKYLNRVV